VKKWAKAQQQLGVLASMPTSTSGDATIRTNDEDRHVEH
jgi:hypothetical protein